MYLVEDRIIHISLQRAIIDGVILNLNDMPRLFKVDKRLSLEPWTYLVWPWMRNAAENVRVWWGYHDIRLNIWPFLNKQCITM